MGTSARPFSSTAGARRTNATTGRSRNSSSPTRTLEASAPGGIFFMKWRSIWDTCTKWLGFDIVSVNDFFCCFFRSKPNKNLYLTQIRMQQKKTHSCQFSSVSVYWWTCYPILVKYTAFVTCPALCAPRQTLEPAVGLAAHLTEVDRAVFSADVLFAFVASWLGLRWDCLACQAEQSFHDQKSTFPHDSILQWITATTWWSLSCCIQEKRSSTISHMSWYKIRTIFNFSK